MKYKDVQQIAKDTIDFAKKNIKPGMKLLDIRKLCEQKMLELGADSFWYWDVGAFVFAGDETTVSVSGKQYVTSVIIPAPFEPPVRSLRATLPAHQSHTFQ